MVEYKYRDKAWKILNHNQIDFLLTISEGPITGWGVRINGVIYSERSPEFIKAIDVFVF